MELNAENASEEDASIHNTDTDEAESAFVPVDDEGFETLSAEIREVLAELAQDKAMDAFRGEYEKLFNALEKSHKNEKRLNTKCQELASEIASKQASVDAAQDKTVEDQETIGSLKKEIEKAWKMVDMTQEREERARETIEALNTEIQNLTKVIEEKTLGAEDTNLNELRKLRDELTSQRDNLKSEVATLKTKQEESSQVLADLRKENGSLEAKISMITQDLQSRTNEMNREIRRKERTEREVKQLKNDVEEKNKEINNNKNEISKIQSSVEKLEVALNEQKVENDGLSKQLDASNNSAADLQKQYESQGVSMQQLEQEVSQKTLSINMKEEEISKARMEITRSARELEDLKKKMAATEKAKDSLIIDKTKLKTEVVDLKKEIGDLKHQALVDKKKMDQTKQSVTVLEHNLRRSNTSSNKQQKEVQKALDTAVTLRNTIKNLENKLDKQRKAISQIEEERDHYLHEATEQAKRVEALLDEVRDAESLVYTYRKDMKDMETQLRQQQNLYSAVRNDRTGLSKSLTEANDEIADLKGKLRVLSHQFDQLKEEVEAKEAALVKESQLQFQLQKEKDEVVAQMDKVKSDVKEMKKAAAEAERSHQMVKERLKATEDELDKNKKLLEKALHERAQLDQKMGKSTEELHQLKKKAVVQERVLARGEAQYKEREEDIRVLKMEIKRLRHDETYLRKSSQNIEELKKEVLSLQKDLLQEKTRVKTLKSEMENPLNIHRWRMLEGKDPTMLELIQKIQSLQKRLIARKEDIVDRELSIQEKDKTLAELRANLARQPGADVVDEARTLKLELAKKTKIIQGLAAEKNMYMTESEQARDKVETMSEELHTIKRKLLDMSKKYTKLKDDLAAAAKATPAASGRFVLTDASLTHQDITVLPSSISVKPKFVGGGFNLSTA